MRGTDYSIPMPQIELPPEQRGTPPTPRLMSLDAFGGLVILAMLLVNNVSVPDSVGYFWKHADWPAMSESQAWVAWWGYATGLPLWAERGVTLASARSEATVDLEAKNEQLRAARESGDKPLHIERLMYEADHLHRRIRALDEESRIASSPWTHLPIFTHCTLADSAMPMFMLFIGVAIPFSAAAAIARNPGPARIWLRVVRRTFTLVILGWVLCYFRDQFAASLHGQSPWTFWLGMDVLQLLGIGFLIARISAELPPAVRVFLATLLLVWHWGMLRFAPQGVVVPAGTFTEQFNAVRYAYDTWPIWERLTLHLGDRVTIGWIGLLSVPPVVATMIIGTLIGDSLRATDIDRREKVFRLATIGAILALIGLLWSFDLPFNKPRWSPPFLLFTSGLGVVVLAMLYLVIDVRLLRGWCYPLVVFGANAIAVYWLSNMAKVVLFDTPCVSADGGFAQSWGKYVVLGFVTTTFGAIAWKFTRSIAIEFGVASYAIIPLALLPAAVVWTRLLTAPVVQTGDASLKSVLSVAVDILTHPLGAHAGGWTFTLAFVGFWWLALELLYRRGIFWKL